MTRFLIPLSVVFMVAGCAFFKPTTCFEGPGGWKLSSSADLDLNVEGVDASKTDSGGGTLKIEKISVANKPSVTIESLEKTMLAFVKQQEAANAGITAFLTGLAQVVDEATNMVNVPAGVIDRLARIKSQIQITKDFINVQMGQLEDMKAALEQQIAANAATTKPSE